MIEKEEDDILEAAKNVFGLDGYEQFDDIYWIMFANIIKKNAEKE